MCFSVLSKNENNGGRRGNPIRVEAGSLYWITGHFQNISSHILDRYQLRTSVGTAQLSLLTQQDARLRPNIWPWRNTSLSTPGWITKLTSWIFILQYLFLIGKCWWFIEESVYLCARRNSYYMHNTMQYENNSFLSREYRFRIHFFLSHGSKGTI